MSSSHPETLFAQETASQRARWLDIKLGPLAAFSIIYIGFNLLAPSQESLSPTYLLGLAISAIAYGFVLNLLMRSLPLRPAGRILVAWPAIYGIQMLNPLLEGLFFTNIFEGKPEMAVGALIFGLALTAPTAIGAALLFRPPANQLPRLPLRAALQQALSAWSPQTLIGRIALAAAMWTGIYLIFGLMVSPWVLPYYTEDAVGFDLELPSLGTLILLQYLRGLLYALALLPLALVTRLDRAALTWAFAALLYTGGALAIFLFSDRFPVFLRLAHGVELAADSLLGGFAFAYALHRRSKRGQQE